jgi:hypothetical protein
MATGFFLFPLERYGDFCICFPPKKKKKKKQAFVQFALVSFFFLIFGSPQCAENSPKKQKLVRLCSPNGTHGVGTLLWS